MAERRSTTKTAHAHGCKKCKVRYEDNCENPKENALCTGCLGHMPWLLLIESRLPKDCCRAFSRLMTDKKEKLAYQLAGDADWWRCTVCCRTQIYDPTKETHVYNPGRSEAKHG